MALFRVHWRRIKVSSLKQGLISALLAQLWCSSSCLHWQLPSITSSINNPTPTPNETSNRVPFHQFVRSASLYLSVSANSATLLLHNLHENSPPLSSVDHQCCTDCVNAPTLEHTQNGPSVSPIKWRPHKTANNERPATSGHERVQLTS